MEQDGLQIEKNKPESRAGVFDPKIEAFVCTYCTYTAADMAGSQRLQYPPTVRVVKYLCTGKVEIIHILKAFEAGADAVFVGG
jgi:coenzyme F420-reducing hydrogenase delta subunit